MEFGEARWSFYCDVVYARQTFAKHRGELADLRQSFWVAWKTLEDAADTGDWEGLQFAFKECYREFGAPGDFGYGTPHGESLKILYESWNTLCKAMAKEVPAPTAV